MADIHFDCPECLQAVVIDASAAGAKVQCPMCSSMLLVPESPSDPVIGESPRRLPVMGVGQGGAEQLDGKQRELAATMEGAVRLGEETKRSHDDVRRLGEGLTATAADGGSANSQEGLELNGRRALEDESKADIERARAELVNAIRDRDALAEEVSRSREKATAVIGEFEKLRTDLAQARADLVAVAEQSAKARAGSARNESELKALIFSSRAELQAQKEAALTGEYEKNAGLRREVEQLQTVMASSSAEQEKLRNEGSQATQDKVALQQRIDILEAEARQRGSDRAQLQADLDVARREREEAFAQMTAKDAELRGTSRRLGEEATAAKERGVELQRRIDTLLAEAESAQMNLEAARAERADVTQKGAVRDAEMREISAQLERQRTVEHTLRLHLEAAEKNAAAALEEVRVFEAEREPINAELTKGRAASDEIAAYLERVTSERHAAHERVAEMERELAGTVEQLQAIENERDMVKSDLEATRAGLERAKQHITVLQSRRDHMRDEVARLKAQLGVTVDVVS